MSTSTDRRSQGCISSNTSRSSVCWDGAADESTVFGTETIMGRRDRSRLRDWSLARASSTHRSHQQLPPSISCETKKCGRVVSMDGGSHFYASVIWHAMPLRPFAGWERKRTEAWCNSLPLSSTDAPLFSFPVFPDSTNCSHPVVVESGWAITARSKN